ncbi:NAD-dependent malic enzyme [Candidatus Fermentibacterales bacterium]|nr:NAD-dependent malic enzyme [Candidatus Fermentibacterales bacterium]
MMNSAELPRGINLLHDPVLNKGTAFTRAERKALGLEGMLPDRVHTQDEQVMRVMGNYRRKNTDLERYIHLIALQDRNETLFYRVLVDHIEELLPIVYTPVVGQACQEYGHIFRRPRGLFISADHKGHMRDILRNWPYSDILVIVVTDGERILGLGDQGADGMGIPVGKLTLYTACAGVNPLQCLPVTLDVGTDNQALLNDPLYIGSRRERIRGPEYDEIVDEFMEACLEVFPDALVQLEDFGGGNAFRLLERYRDKYCTFDDDIQGTGSVALAGVMSALRMTKSRMSDQKFLFLGAGQAGIGIADTLVACMVKEGLSLEEARGRCWHFDYRGMLSDQRTDIAVHQKPYAHKVDFENNLLAAVKHLRPTGLIGVSGQPGLFNEAILTEMASINEQPIIFALSNPTSKAECTAESAYRFTDGRAIFASGSPFCPVEIGGSLKVSGQCNNSYIFPGVGLGVVGTKATRVVDEMFVAAAEALAKEVTWEDLEKGSVFPPLTRIRDVSLTIATAVAEMAFDMGLARDERPADVRKYLQQQVYEPRYRDYV